MTIYEDDIKEETWSNLLEDFEEDIKEEIANHYEDATFADEEDYEKYIEDCIRNVVDESDFWSRFEDEIDSATNYISDCEEYLCDCGLEDAVNNFIDSGMNGCDNFDTTECTKQCLEENLCYEYDDAVADILYGFVEMMSDDPDKPYDYEGTVKKCYEDYYEEDE